MVVDMTEHGRQRGHIRLRAARRVAGDARQAHDLAVPIEQRLLPGQAPSLPPVGIEMQLQSSVDRNALAQNAEVLSFEAIAQRRRKNIARRSPDEVGLPRETAAPDQRLVHRHIARIPVLEEEDHVVDAIEQLLAEERTAEPIQKVPSSFAPRFHRRGYCADSRVSASDARKIGAAACGKFPGARRAEPGRRRTGE